MGLCIVILMVDTFCKKKYVLLLKHDSRYNLIVIKLSYLWNASLRMNNFNNILAVLCKTKFKHLILGKTHGFVSIFPLDFQCPHSLTWFWHGFVYVFITTSLSYHGCIPKKITRKKALRYGLGVNGMKCSRNAFNSWLFLWNIFSELLLSTLKWLI